MTFSNVFTDKSVDRPGQGPKTVQLSKTGKVDMKYNDQMPRDMALRKIIGNYQP
jgi:hypothetical protein